MLVLVLGIAVVVAHRWLAWPFERWMARTAGPDARATRIARIYWRCAWLVVGGALIVAAAADL